MTSLAPIDDAIGDLGRCGARSVLVHRHADQATNDTYVSRASPESTIRDYPDEAEGTLWAGHESVAVQLLGRRHDDLHANGRRSRASNREALTGAKR
jgi:hypothetical protein